VTAAIGTAALDAERRRGVGHCVMHGVDTSARLKVSPTIAIGIVSTAPVVA